MKILSALVLSAIVPLSFAGGPQPMSNIPVPAQPSQAVYVEAAPTQSAVMYPGSLKENIIRIAGNFGWSQVVWNVPNDYNWVGQTRIYANGLPGILTRILVNYPLQAVFYRGNHVLEIKPRTIK